MKKFFVSLVILMFFTLSCIVGCAPSNSNTAENAESTQQEQTKEIMKEVNNHLGLPAIKNFQQKKLMKMIQELCDQENLVCYAYIKSDYQGKLVFIGKCIGFGIPFSAQYTNPMKIWDQETDGGAISKYQDAGEIQVLPQADPNGLYMPTSSSATWLMMIDSKGNSRPVYIEPEIVVSPFPLN